MKWLEPDWYRYLWHRRLPAAAKIGVTSLLLAGLTAGGVFAANQVSDTGASTGGSAYIVSSTTVMRNVTVRKGGRAVVQRIPVVHTVKLQAEVRTITGFATVTNQHVVTTVRLAKVRYVPVTKTVKQQVTSVVARDGTTITQVTTRPVTVRQTVPVTLASTQTQVVTSERTLTDVRTSTIERTTTLATKTNTVTTIRTTTSTVTTPPVTSTVTRTVTTTQIQTRPVTTTVVVTTTKTVTQPAVTATVTTTGK